MMGIVLFLCQDSEGQEGNETEDKGKSDPGSDLKPQVLWSLFFNCPETSDCDLTANVPTNVFLCSGPDVDLDFEHAVKQVKCTEELMSSNQI